MLPFARSLFLALALLLLGFAPVCAEEIKPDDHVQMDLSAEGWVTTKTARVLVSVEAAVTGNTAGTMRANMTKAVGDVAKGDWRLTSFNREQDQTGMERWSAVFEARLPESDLNGINEAAKKASKTGMQITVSNVDFSPTLEETQAVLGQVRTQIYKDAAEQLTALNTALPGRNYRISAIDFMGESRAFMPPRPMVANAKMLSMESASATASASPSVERSEKLTVSAHVTFSSLPPTATK